MRLRLFLALLTCLLALPSLAKDPKSEQVPCKPAAAFKRQQPDLQESKNWSLTLNPVWSPGLEEIPSSFNDRPIVVVFGGRGLDSRSTALGAIGKQYPFVFVEITVNDLSPSHGPYKKGLAEILYWELIQDLEDLLEGPEFQDRQLILGGHSFGGLIAGTLAIRMDPKRLRRLFMINTPLTNTSFRNTELNLLAIANADPSFRLAREAFLEDQSDQKRYQAMMTALAKHLFAEPQLGVDLLSRSAHSADTFSILRMPWRGSKLFPQNDENSIGKKGFADLLAALPTEKKIIFAGGKDPIYEPALSITDHLEIGGLRFAIPKMSHFPDPEDGELICQIIRNLDLQQNLRDHNNP